jgi:hypothetical protein
VTMTAEERAAAGWRFIAVPRGSKNPGRVGWQHERTDMDAILAHEKAGGNVGVLLGEPSGGLVDVDLDAPETIALADGFLPVSNCIFGRASKARSHRLYNADPLIATEKFRDPLANKDDHNGMLVELRSTGCQTLVPPSTNPTGERVAYADDGEPAHVVGVALRGRVAQLASAALLARNWPGGDMHCRHDLALALAGYLLRRGLDADTTARIMGSAARVARDEEWRDREQAVRDTAKRLAAGEPATGAPTLTGLLDAKIIAKLSDWLGLENGRADAGAQKNATASDTATNGHALRWRTAREIAATSPATVSWIVPGLLARGAVTECDGKIKVAGKTTTALAMTAAILEGAPFLGQPTMKAKVVLLSEQPDASLRVALARAGLLERDDLVILSHCDARRLDWPAIVEAAVAKANEIGAGVLIVDTFGAWSQLVGNAENDAGAAFAAIAPLQAVAAVHELAVLILRHERKSGGDVGDSARGASAIGGAVDIIVSLRRMKGFRTTIRRLEVESRFDERPPELIEWTGAGYVVVDPEEGKREHAARSAKHRQQVLDALRPDRAGALTVQELADATGLCRTKVQTVAKALVDQDAAGRYQADEPKHPFRYYRTDSTCRTDVSRRVTTAPDSTTTAANGHEATRDGGGGTPQSTHHHVSRVVPPGGGDRTTAEQQRPAGRRDA